MRRLTFLLSTALLTLCPVMAQSLEECQRLARANYPLIQRYELLERTTGLTVSNIQKGWLPQLSAQAQATLQSDVTAWPGEMKQMLQQFGVDIPGMRKDQYRVGVELNQQVWDGGRLREQKRIARLQGDVEQAQTDVALYQVADRVNQLYFGVLLLDERIRLNRELQELLTANLQKLEAMLRGGTAMQSDVSSVKAELLSAAQTETDLSASRDAFRRMLAVFCGQETVTPEKPTLGSPLPAATLLDNRRPELQSIAARLQLTEAQEHALGSALMPRLTVFAQGYYGYPGYNMFESMMKRDWSLNGMVGARLTWNIGALYTRHNDRARLDAQRSLLHVERDVFLFNSRLQQTEQQAAAEKYRQLMERDDDIILLRTQVRQAAESKLRHGIIDVSNLLQEITRENQARIQRSSHEIEMLKAAYDLKYTINQ